MKPQVSNGEGCSGTTTIEPGGIGSGETFHDDSPAGWVWPFGSTTKAREVSAKCCAAPAAGR